ncbi:hypothetical protein L9F63_023040 [Diploptera punctata]|uniref:Ionotropic glutamate receptor C-terminal domain-containing protein n=1 Tax=Diploptera punctata TaxID=6984 RepID=A0AAD8E9T4_DIPPU|nr:hypothetical protein L9F63_023040 [Diploptera punctata]
MFASIEWYVPCPKKNFLHGHFYKVFDLYLWILLFAVFIISTILSIIIQKLDLDEANHSISISYGFYCIWAVIVSVSAPEMPTSIIPRILFLMWLSYSLAISTVFQVFFTSFLIEPGVDKQISSIAEIINSSLSFVGKSELLISVDIELNESNIEMPHYLSKAADDGVEYFFEANDYALIANNLDMRVKFERYFQRGLKPCSFTYFRMSMNMLYFAFNSPYYEPYGYRLMQYYESGLIAKLINDYAASNFVSLNRFKHFQEKVKYRKYITEDYFIFKLKHLRIPFLMYICLNAISFIVLLVEILVFKTRFNI